MVCCSNTKKQVEDNLISNDKTSREVICKIMLLLFL